MFRNERNRGHGPSLMAAYRQALDGNPDFILQVDGDGQFHGSDLRRVLVLLTDEARAVCGVRRFRQDPWFRMIMTGVLRSYLQAAFSVRARDANCPLRGYDAGVLRQLLDGVPQDSLVPNLYLTILAARNGVPLLEVDVSHRVRRGAGARGTTWGKGMSPIPWRLLRFSARAVWELLAFAPAWAGPVAASPKRSRPRSPADVKPASPLDRGLDAVWLADCGRSMSVGTRLPRLHRAAGHRGTAYVGSASATDDDDAGLPWPGRDPGRGGDSPHPGWCWKRRSSAASVPCMAAVLPWRHWC